LQRAIAIAPGSSPGPISGCVGWPELGLAYQRERWLYPSFYARAILEGNDLAAALERARAGGHA
jgi:hypothetical protein